MTNSVQIKASVCALELALEGLIDSGELCDAAPSFSTKHWFSPVIEEYGCGTYARELSMPAGSIIVGKIHKHAHISFLLKGKIAIASESGSEIMEAPCTFVSKAGIKRAGYVIEDAVVTNVHLTRFSSEDELDEIEEEVIAESYSQIGLDEPDVALVGKLLEDLT
tara:strand:+ start:132 stop:626 length:495 start_codon:yes stop_codon:yes gene_type:complete